MFLQKVARHFLRSAMLAVGGVIQPLSGIPRAFDHFSTLLLDTKSLGGIDASDPRRRQATRDCRNAFLARLRNLKPPC